MLRNSATVLASVACVAVINFSFVLETRTMFFFWPILEGPKAAKMEPTSLLRWGN